MLFVTPKNNMSVMYRSCFHSATVFQYGHWMITFIRENVCLNVLNILIHRRILPGIHISEMGQIPL